MWDNMRRQDYMLTNNKLYIFIDRKFYICLQIFYWKYTGMIKSKIKVHGSLYKDIKLYRK